MKQMINLKTMLVANKSKMVLRIFYQLSIIRLKVAFSHHLDNSFLGCRCANRKDGHNKNPTIFEDVEKNDGLLPPTSNTLFMQKLQAIWPLTNARRKER